jgi:hypothetical protein
VAHLRHDEMKRKGPATKAALAGVLCACLAVPAPADAARRPIRGTLDRTGLVVVALAADGSTESAPANPRFRLAPPDEVVVLHLRGRGGAYLGPVVVAGRDRRVTLGVRAGARLGRIELRNGYALVSRVPVRRSIDRRVTARARRGKPLGTGAFGGLPGPAQGRSAQAEPGAAGARRIRTPPTQRSSSRSPPLRLPRWGSPGSCSRFDAAAGAA